MARSISRRTASPNRRRRRSRSMAASRSSASPSSRSRSALRVTRKAQCDSTSMPGNSSPRRAAMICSRGTKRSPSGRATKRGSSGGTLTRAKRRSPVRGLRTQHGQVERQAGDVGEGVAGVDGQRGEHREDAGVEHVDQVGPVVVVESAPSRQTRMPAVGQRRHHAARRRSSDCWSISSATRDPDGPQLLRRRQPVGRRAAEPGRLLLLEDGHPHLEELVEVAG